MGEESIKCDALFCAIKVCDSKIPQICRINEIFTADANNEYTIPVTSKVLKKSKNGTQNSLRIIDGNVARAVTVLDTADTEKELEKYLLPGKRIRVPKVFTDSPFTRIINSKKKIQADESKAAKVTHKKTKAGVIEVKRKAFQSVMQSEEIQKALSIRTSKEKRKNELVKKVLSNSVSMDLEDTGEARISVTPTMYVKNGLAHRKLAPYGNAFESVTNLSEAKELIMTLQQQNKELRQRRDTEEVQPNEVISDPLARVLSEVRDTIRDEFKNRDNAFDGNVVSSLAESMTEVLPNVKMSVRGLSNILAANTMKQRTNRVITEYWTPEQRCNLYMRKTKKKPDAIIVSPQDIDNIKLILKEMQKSKRLTSPTDVNWECKIRKWMSDKIKWDRGGEKKKVGTRNDGKETGLRIVADITGNFLNEDMAEEEYVRSRIQTVSTDKKEKKGFQGASDAESSASETELNTSTGISIDEGKYVRQRIKTASKSKKRRIGPGKSLCKFIRNRL